jgi:hypothetical protein
MPSFKIGSVLQSQQPKNGIVLSPMTYAYNLSGAMIEQKYPSGRVVKNVLDNDGDLAIARSKKNANAGYFSYADSFTYMAAGAVSSMQLGDQIGLDSSKPNKPSDNNTINLSLPGELQRLFTDRSSQWNQSLNHLCSNQIRSVKKHYFSDTGSFLLRIPVKYRIYNSIFAWDFCHSLIDSFP